MYVCVYVCVRCLYICVCVCGTRRRVLSHVNSTRHRHTSGQTVPNTCKRTVMPLVKSYNIKVSTLKYALINYQSLCNKANGINDYIKDGQTDAVLLTETWLSGGKID